MKRRRFRPTALTSRRKLLLIALVALPVLAVFTFGNRGLLKRFELESRYNQAHEDMYQERETGDSLRGAIERLKTDSLEVEKLARERFGMARKGEEVYKISEDK
ncbi:MAG: septum formation initiator family protein [Ignavibacteriae bacterium]|nr:septum formation initiator family protein [Ignavibacteriota bacterium]MCB9215910.1 septum formation initiator family protein [Ignavibacteria bacterium]